MVRESPNQRTLAAYEQAAHIYRAQSPAQPYPSIAAFLDLVAARIPGGTVLELGSGPGLDAKYLETRGLTVRRTDATVAFVDALHVDGQQASVVNAITDDLGSGYDAIYAGAMLLHLATPDFRAVLRKARDAADVLAFTVKEGDGESWTTERLNVPRWYRYWRAAELRPRLAEAGWKVERLLHVMGKREPWLQVIAS